MKFKHPILSLFSVAGAVSMLSIVAHAQNEITDHKTAIELGAPFADNAILQRQMLVPVWGWAEPGITVTVEFAGQKKVATTGDDGKWMLRLDQLKANPAAQKMTITESNGKTRTLNNVLVGEVWLASGQSNMQWIAAKSDVGMVLQKEIAKRVAAGREKAPVIREAKVTNYFAHLHPIERAEAQWSEGGSQTSAVAYSFAYKLHKELNVPIGILNCSFSQTAIQAWTPREGFAGGKDPYTKAIYQKILQTDPRTPEHKTAWDGYYKRVNDVLEENRILTKNGQPAKRVLTKTPGNLSGNRDATWLFNARINPMIPFAIRGAIWNQGYANMGEGLMYYDNLHSMIRGWRSVWERPTLPVYFHQFYCPGQKVWSNKPSVSSVAEMRLGTWMARDIPYSGMASQIDITGAIHYRNKALPGQRLALHALKNQYKKNLVADGPMFKFYKVEGSNLIVTLDNIADGLVVAETGTNSKNAYALPTVIPNGEARVKLFYLAGADRVWHPASIKIEGSKVIVSSPFVKSPRGVSYATGGVGSEPNIYNKALLPTTPFIYYDQKLVTRKNWNVEKLTVANEVINPNSVGKIYEYRKLALLSTQFRDNAVFQSGKELTIWGSAIHNYGYEAKGEAVIKFNFAGIEKIIPVVKGMNEWKVTVPALEASAEPKELTVSYYIDGKLVHKRVCKNIVIGDVYYVAAPPLKVNIGNIKKSSGIVRMITNKAKRFSSPRPSRYSVSVSTTPLNRFAAKWADASGLAAKLGNSIAAKTGKPVGIIFMQTRMQRNKDKKSIDAVTLKSWIPTKDLKLAPSLMADYKDLGVAIPGNPYYSANARKYILAWKGYWTNYVPKMMSSKSVPDGQAWGSYPQLTSSVTSKASQVHNVYVKSFTPAALKGILFFSSENMVAADKGVNFGSELAVLANSLKEGFGDKETPFYFTRPSKKLAPMLSFTENVSGDDRSVELKSWSDKESILELIEVVTKDLNK